MWNTMERNRGAFCALVVNRIQVPWHVSQFTPAPIQKFWATFVTQLCGLKKLIFKTSQLQNTAKQNILCESSQTQNHWMYVNYNTGLGPQNILMSTGGVGGLGWGGAGYSYYVLPGPSFLWQLVETKHAPQGWCCFIHTVGLGAFSWRQCRATAGRILSIFY